MEHPKIRRYNPYRRNPSLFVYLNRIFKIETNHPQQPIIVGETGHLSDGSIGQLFTERLVGNLNCLLLVEHCRSTRGYFSFNS